MQNTENGAACMLRSQQPVAAAVFVKIVKLHKEIMTLRTASLYVRSLKPLTESGHLLFTKDFTCIILFNTDSRVVKIITI